MTHVAPKINGLNEILLLISDWNKYFVDLKKYRNNLRSVPKDQHLQEKSVICFPWFCFIACLKSAIVYFI